MNLRKQQALQTYYHILSAAKELAEDKPYESLSVEQICECADISKGGFYHHFSSKDELVALLYGCKLGNMLDKQLIPKFQKETAFTLLKIYIETVIEFLETNPRDTVIRCWLMLIAHPEITDRDFFLESFQIFYQIVELGKKEGTIRVDLDTEFCQSLLNGAITGIILYGSAFKEAEALKKYAFDSLELIYQTFSQK